LKQKIKIVFLFACLFGVASVLARTSQTQTNQKKTAEQEYKNIQVLKGMPADQMDRVMALMSGSLGVKCNFCHATDQYEKDDKKEKQTARTMIKMMLGINKDMFNGRNEVTCYTCHNGQSHPASVPSLSVGQRPEVTNRPKETLPTVDQVLDKYVQALGGKLALEKVSTRVTKGSRINDDGTTVQEEVYQKAPNKLLVVTSYPQYAISVGYNETRVWMMTGKNETNIGEEEMEQIKRDAQLFQPTKLKEIYTQLAVASMDKIGDKEVYVVRAATATGKRERLYFDKQTGLLLRRYTASQTLLGSVPFQVDYLDYKDVEGVKIPFTIHWSIPGRVWSRKVSEVQNNSTIDDSKFNPPAMKN
jgi:hypothetical protein